jgi:hypothetical protein
MRIMKAATIPILAMMLSAACAVPSSSIGVFAQWQDSKDADSGYGFGVKHDFSIIPIISVEARASWLMYSGSGDEGDLDMFPLEAFACVKSGMLYGGVGVGYYILSGDNSPKDSLGGFAAMGIDFNILGLGAFGELRYLYLEPDLDNEKGGTVDMSGIGANVGVTLPF